MNLRRSLQRLDRFLTLDDTQTGLWLGPVVGFGVGFGFGFFRLFLDVRGEFFGLGPFRLVCLPFLGVLDGGLGVFVFRVTRGLRGGDDAGRGGYRGQLLGELLDRVFFLDLSGLPAREAGSSRPFGATMMYTTAPMNTNVDVNELTRIPAMCVADVAAHQLDPEPAEAVAGDIHREQPAVADLEPAVDLDQRRENQYVP